MYGSLYKNFLRFERELVLVVVPFVVGLIGIFRQCKPPKANGLGDAVPERTSSARPVMASISNLRGHGASAAGANQAITFVEEFIHRQPSHGSCYPPQNMCIVHGESGARTIDVAYSLGRVISENITEVRLPSTDEECCDKVALALIEAHTKNATDRPVVIIVPVTTSMDQERIAVAVEQNTRNNSNVIIFFALVPGVLPKPALTGHPLLGSCVELKPNPIDAHSRTAVLKSMLATKCIQWIFVINPMALMEHVTDMTCRDISRCVNSASITAKKRTTAMDVDSQVTHMDLVVAIAEQKQPDKTAGHSAALSKNRPTTKPPHLYCAVT
jgi:hypothetical protein